MTIQLEDLSLCKKDFTLIDFDFLDRNDRDRVLKAIQSTSNGWKKLLTSLREWILEYHYLEEEIEDPQHIQKEFLIRQIRLFHSESVYIEKILKEAISGCEMYEMVKEFYDEIPHFMGMQIFSHDQIRVLEGIRKIRYDL